MECNSLHEAVRNGEVGCVEERLSLGDDVNATVDGTSALYQVVHSYTESTRKRRTLESQENVFKTIFDTLLAAPGINLDAKTEISCKFCTKAGDSVIHETVIKGLTDFTRTLVDNGADINAVNELVDNRTLIHEACYYDNLEAIDYLIENLRVS